MLSFRLSSIVKLTRILLIQRLRTVRAYVRSSTDVMLIPRVNTSN